MYVKWSPKFPDGVLMIMPFTARFSPLLVSTIRGEAGVKNDYISNSYPIPGQHSVRVSALIVA